jgi:hypothetical protein
MTIIDTKKNISYEGVTLKESAKIIGVRNFTIKRWDELKYISNGKKEYNEFEINFDIPITPTVKYIYALLRNEIPFYIGATTNVAHRAFNHRQRFGSDIEIETLDVCSIEDWEFWERHYISLFRSFGFKLENIHDGGRVYYKQF